MHSPVENPFAVKTKKSNRLAPLISSLKGLAMVAVLFGVLIVAQSQSRRWLLDRWVSGIADLPPADQVERLLQINALGDIATASIAGRLSAADEPVAAAAYALLREQQNAWSLRSDRDLGRAHRNMAEGIESVVEQLDGQRALWAQELLSQTLIECADRTERELDDAYSAASRVLAKLTPNNGSGALADGSTDQLTSAPLPLTPQASGVPRLVPTAARMQAVQLSSEPAAAVAGLVASPAGELREPQTTMAAASQPEPLLIKAEPASNRTVSATTPTLTVLAEADTAVRPSRSAELLTQSSIEAYDTKSVIALLGSEQTATRDQAVDELVRRGLSNEEIRIANQLASPIIDVRLGLLESIVHRTDLDPRPWLLWLAEDSQREVRMRAISTLATMNDPAVKQALQARLAQEHDSTVIAQLRRALGSK